MIIIEELVEKTKQGDKEAYSELISSLQTYLYKVAITRTKNEDDAQEVIQIAFIKAYLRISKLKKNNLFKTWITKILINECNKFYKTSNSKKEYSYEILNNEISNQDETEEKINFDFICNKLNKEEGTIILLYYMEKYTDKEIGKILNMKESTIRTKRARTKDKIRKIYKEYGRI